MPSGYHIGLCRGVSSAGLKTFEHIKTFRERDNSLPCYYVIHNIRILPFLGLFYLSSCLVSGGEGSREGPDFSRVIKVPPPMPQLPSPLNRQLSAGYFIFLLLHCFLLGSRGGRTNKRGWGSSYTVAIIINWPCALGSPSWGAFRIHWRHKMASGHLRLR